MSWLLLLHQVPPIPPYFRAKVLRRLNQIGALQIKNSVYILPERDETKEDFQWLHSEISSEGGEAWLFRADAVSGVSDESLIASFRTLRTNDYSQLLQSLEELSNLLSTNGTELDRRSAEWRKLKRRFLEVRQLDFFEASGRGEVEDVMQKIEVALGGAASQPAVRIDARDLVGKVWVTRRGVKVDRMASAWLIRRFVDASAKFSFVGDRHPPAQNQMRFDMFEGELTHEGDLCTFEVLVNRLRLKDPALIALAQIVHDIDLKDQKYQRAETAGLAVAVLGIAARESDDQRRIDEGGRLFDAVYAAFQEGAISSEAPALH